MTKKDKVDHVEFTCYANDGYKKYCDGEDKKETPQKPKEGQGKPEERKSQLSPQQIQNLLDAMQNAEKKSQEKLEGKKVKGAPVKTKKDW